MKKVYVCITLLFAGGVSIGDDEWMSKIRRDHPRMFFNRDTWPAVKARAEGPVKRFLRRLLKECDGYPDDPVCTGTGAPEDREGFVVDKRSTGISPIREWGTESARCALAWRMTGDPKYLRKAKAMLLANVKGYNEAYANRRAVNWYSHTRVNSLCAYDWIYEALTDDERRAIIVPLLNHVEEAQRRPGRPYIRRLNSSGYTEGCYGVKNLMWYAGLAAYGDGHCDELAEKLLKEGHAYNLQLLKFRSDSAGDDGALATGTAGYAMGSYPWAHFNVFHTWLSATGENLAERYRPMALFPNWVWWLWLPDAEKPSQPLFHGLGDTFHDTGRVPVGNLYEHLCQYMHFFGKSEPEAAKLAKTLSEMCPTRRIGTRWPVYPFLFGPQNGTPGFTKEELVNAPLKARHFESLGQIYMRSGWSPEDTAAVFLAGSRITNHKHYDEGSFVIWKHDLLALDSGSRAGQTDWNLKYYYAQSVAHNVVLIHKPGEPLSRHWGPAYSGPEGKHNYGGMHGRTSKVLAFETNGRYSYAAADLKEAYGEKCTENVRQFIHLQPDLFVVYDRVGAADPSYAKQWLIHFQNKPVVEGRTVRADSRKGRLFCETVFPLDAKIETVGGPGKEWWANGRNWDIYPKWLENTRRKCARDGRGPYWGEWRTETRPGSARKDDRFLHVLTATSTNVLAGVKTRTERNDLQDGVTLSVTDPSSRETVETTVMFNRTGKVGGTMTVRTFRADGSVKGSDTRPLADFVTRQSGVMLR